MKPKAPSFTGMRPGIGGPQDVNLQFDLRLREVMSATRLNFQEMLTDAGDDAAVIAKELATVDSGELRDSIEYEIGVHKDQTYVTLVARAEHAAKVEFGTVYHPSRPFMIPALRFAMSNFKEGVNRKGIFGQVTADIKPYTPGGKKPKRPSNTGGMA